MLLASWLRTGLWPVDDWRRALRAEAAQLLAERPIDGGKVLDVARALEHVDPDRNQALDAYLAAWTAAQSRDALGAARRIAREVRRLDDVAQLAMREHERLGDPGLLWTAAAAWIDAGEAPRAGRVLGLASRRGEDPRIETALAAIEGTLVDPRGEVARWHDRGMAAEGAAAARALLHAARLARLARLGDDVYARLLRTALDRCPEDDEVAHLVEDLLVVRGDPDELLTFYRIRLAARTTPRVWADTVRAAATRLVVGGVAPGLGLRLVRRGLDRAYDAGLVDVPGHLASWSLLVDHARAARATRELMPLVVQALRLPLGDDDRLWIARIGLEIAWKDAGDQDVARPYAAIVVDLVPDHHDVRDFVEFAIEKTNPGVAVPADDAGLAMTLVYLDEHDGRIVDAPAAPAIVAAARTEAVVKDAPFVQPPPAAVPAWLSKRTQEMVALGKEAVEQASELAEAAEEAEAAEAAAAVPAVPAPAVAAEAAPEPAPTLVAAVAVTPTPPAASPPIPALRGPLAMRPMIPQSAQAALKGITGRIAALQPPVEPLDSRDRAPRVVVPVDVTVELPDGTTRAAVARDISTTGLFLLLRDAVALDAEIGLDLELPAGDGLAVTRHKVWARIKRKNADGYGLELIDPGPDLVDNIATLAR